MFQATPAPYQPPTHEINIPQLREREREREDRRHIIYDDMSLPELVVKGIIGLLQFAYSLTMFVIIILTFTYIKDMKDQLGDMSNNINSINNAIHNITMNT